MIAGPMVGTVERLTLLADGRTVLRSTLNLDLLRLVLNARPFFTVTDPRRWAGGRSANLKVSDPQ